MRALALAAALLAVPALAFPPAASPFPDGHPLAVRFDGARDAVEREDWVSAERRFAALAAEAPEVADLWSYLGLARRKQGRLTDAEAAYDRALALAPAHPGALEYLGELRLQQDDVAAAEALLARLDAACPAGCEERRELAAAIEAWRSAR